ncbi:hypothetical protein BQ8482_130100 [Mesorhizobium delmotii]|uniref:Uncharacterized protein n=1 Tax=Mesorhizobium delmotii TaxID=1631247 RepID=A0A2P9AGD7_9HYPH|nr:hypothetical protein BQ8482_130100 [Mesorhizobium delmotii]
MLKRDNSAEGSFIIDPAGREARPAERGRWQRCGQEIEGARHPHRSPPQNGGPVPESSRRREIFAAVEASPSAVRRAKRAADESCGRTILYCKLLASAERIGVNIVGERQSGDIAELMDEAVHTCGADRLPP